jgi:small-conductance mechanosensitive channel
MFELHITDVSRVVQQVIAPAFVLAGIGSFLNVMSQRMSRISDLAREAGAQIQDRLALRARLIRLAMALCTAAAVLICALIAVMFVDALLTADLTLIVAAVFVLAMLTMIAGLAAFMREVFVATAGIRGRHQGH